MVHKSRILFLPILLSVLLGCDQITKQMARARLKDRDTISFFYNTLRLDYVENTGTLFGLGSNLTGIPAFIIHSLIPWIILLLLGIYTIKQRNRMSQPAFISMGFILGGGFGNIMDRILSGSHVTDFIDIGIKNFRTGFFNLADFFLITGIIILIVMLRKDRKKHFFYSFNVAKGQDPI